MLIKDIVTQAPDATFANDVKLDAYFSPKQNLKLACGYQFTWKVPDVEGRNLVSSVAVFDKLQRSVLDATENRHVVIATYGHGKSHLALALANFFGKPLVSPELSCMLERIRIAATDSITENFRDFKSSRLPFLVVCLRGDQAQGLSAQFLQGLEAAIADNEATRGTPLPFWFEAAERFLDGLTAEQRAQADDFLRKSNPNTDVADLLAKVRGKQAEYHDLCIQVHQRLFGTRPDFGGEVSLQRAVNWAVETFVEGDPKVGGLLILFDEFSAFIEDYAQRRQAGSSGSLQDLLNGISDQRGRALFVAFSQHDPDTVADNAFRLAGSDEQLQSLHKELTRLDPRFRYNLYSSLETVLCGYLRQNEQQWESFYAQTHERMQDAADYCRTLLYPRYEDNKGWADGRFDEIVTHGCFPLHPLTTGLFCSLEFKNSARRVLQFVLSELEDRLEQPAVKDGKPNWVYPIALVDFFNKNLAADMEYEEYEIARNQAGPEIPDVQKAVLKAVLLFSIGQLKLRRLRFDQAVAELCGYSASQCEQALRDLEADGYLHFNTANMTYQFSVGGRGNKLERLIKQEIQGKTLDWNALFDINTKTGSWLKPVEVDGITWGHRDDWECKEMILTRELFDVNNLRRLVPLYRIGLRDTLEDGARGCLIRLVAKDQADVEWFEQHAQSVLDEAFPGDNPLPVVLAVPHRPRKSLLDNLLIARLLSDAGWVRRNEAGNEAYSSRKERTEREITAELKELRGWADYVVPQPYRAAVQIGATPDNVLSVLRVCYAAAYESKPTNPRKFFTQYPSNRSALRKAVSLVCRFLVTDKLAEHMDVVNADPVARDLVKNFLRPSAWGLVDMSNHICIPTSIYAKKAWNVLDATFGPGTGAAYLKQVMLILLNPPYGYDYNQLALLFCAWYGYTRRDLEMKAGATVCRLEDYLSLLEQPKAFFAKLSVVDQVRIARRDPHAQEKAIRDLLEEVRTRTLTRDQARGHIARFIAYADDDRADRELREAAREAARRQQTDLDAADAYVQELDRIQSGIGNNSTKLDDLLTLRREAANLPTLGRVNEQWPTSAELCAQVLRRIEAVVNQLCGQWETLNHITQYDQKKEQLTRLKKRMETLGRSDLQERTVSALQRLEASKQNYEDRLKDTETIAAIRAMSERDQLRGLRDNLQKLGTLPAHSDDTKALIAQKHQMLEGRIREEGEAVCALQAKADSVMTLEQARALREEVLGERANYRDTPELEVLETTQERCRSLEQFFLQIEQATQPPLISPEDAKARFTQLNSAEQAHEGILNDNQRTLVTVAQGKIHSVEQEKIRAAQEKLEDWEKQSGTTKNPEGLLKLMESPSSFLPPEGIRRLEKLCGLVQKRIDEDEVQVVTARFRKIKDRAKQLACLRELQRIVEQQDAQ